MRQRSLFVWLAVALLLVGLAGCNSSDDNVSGAGGFTVGGTVSNIAGTANQVSAIVQLFNNGQPFGQATVTDANGRFTFNGVPSGTYAVVVTRAGASPLVRTVYGPVTITQNTAALSIQAETQANFEAQTGIAPPPDNTQAKLVAVALNEQGQLVNITVTVGALPPVGPAAPAEVTVLTPGSFPVTVEGDGQSVTVPGVPLVGGEITLLNVVLSGAPPATGFTVTGAAVDAYSGAPIVGQTVTLMQQGNQVGNAVVTDANGTFLFSDVPAGTDYRLRAEATNYADTVYGPFAVNFDRTGVLVPVSTLADLLANNNVSPPADNTTSTLVIFAQDAQGTPFNPTVALNGGAPFTDATVPTIRNGLAPGAFTIAITNLVDNTSVTLQNVNLRAGRITVLQARTGLNGM